MPDIVLLDDDDLLRLTLGELLEEQGYSVLQAGTGTDVLRVLDEAAAGCVLIADRQLRAGDEWRDGHALAVEALARCPQLGVIYISGAPDAEDRVLSARERILLKPFELPVLFGLVRDLRGDP